MDLVLNLNIINLFIGIYLSIMLVFGYLLLSNKPFINRLSNAQIMLLIVFAPIIVLFEIMDSIFSKFHSKLQQN